MRGGRSRGGGRPQRRRKIPASLHGFESPLVKERKERRSKGEVGAEDDEDKDDDDDDESSEEDDSWASEDDPDRLWCTCQQPHNNRSIQTWFILFWEPSFVWRLCFPCKSQPTQPGTVKPS